MFTLFITLLQRLFLPIEFKKAGGIKDNMVFLKFEVFLYFLVAGVIFIKWLLK